MSTLILVLLCSNLVLSDATYLRKDVVPGTTMLSPAELVNASNISKSEIIKLYPNPNNGHFSVEFLNPLENDNSEIVITDMAGKQVYNSPVMKEEKLKKFDLSGSRSGVYVMLIKDKDIYVTRKFIKN